MKGKNNKHLPASWYVTTFFAYGASCILIGLLFLQCWLAQKIFEPEVFYTITFAHWIFIFGPLILGTILLIMSYVSKPKK